jgi:hypothetical protein
MQRVASAQQAAHQRHSLVLRLCCAARLPWRGAECSPNSTAARKSCNPTGDCPRQSPRCNEPPLTPVLFARGACVFSARVRAVRFGPTLLPRD